MQKLLCFILFIITIGTITPVSLFSQAYVADTITVNFSDIFNQSLQYNVNAAESRIENVNFISVFEKKKLLVFPVDQIVVTNKPLKNYFVNVTNNNQQPGYFLNIHEFYINYNESIFNKTLKLDTYIGLSRIDNLTDTTYLGVFYYQKKIKCNKKHTISQNYTNLYNTFSSDFNNSFKQVIDSSATKPGNFIPHLHVAPKNFYVSIDAIYGYNFYGVDAEIWFSEPELSNKFKRKARLFRYLQYKNRKSAGFSTNVSQFNYRINQNWLFTNKNCFLFGFNQWLDIDENKRKFEEMFLLQYSFAQRITYNKLNKTGLTLGVGLFEEASYILYNKPFFSAGLIINIAYKF